MLLEWLRPAATECRERTGVSEGFKKHILFIFLEFENSMTFILPEAIKDFDSGEIERIEIHENSSLKCYMYCVFEMTELINDKGDLFIMKLADHIESNYDDEVQNIAFQMGRKCLRAEGDNNCKKAFWYHKCWKSKDPVVCFFFFSLNFHYFELYKNAFWYFSSLSTIS